MTAKCLSGHVVERIWGRKRLPGPFAGFSAGEPVGELWFRNGLAQPGELLVKYLFTSERLSIQVHPDDQAARALGHDCGKDEAWLVLDAQPGAVIGLGLKHEVTAAELRAAAGSGEIENLIDWRPVKTGDILFSPGGTIHAIGAGLTLVEIQQDLDLTYRLYDYGRPRELHLDEAIAVAVPGPWRSPGGGRDFGNGRKALAGGCAFVVETWRGQVGTIEAPSGGPVTLVPLVGDAALDGVRMEPLSVWVVEGRAELDSKPDSEILVAYPGSRAKADLLVSAAGFRAAS